MIRAQSSYLSTRFNARAMRVLGERGARLHETEQVPGIGGVYTEPQPDAFDSTPEIHSFRAVNSLAAAFDLAYNRRLLGEELKQLIEDVRCSTSVRLTSKPIGDKSADAEATSVLALGDHRGSSLRLVCDPPEDPFKAILLGDILRIGRAALELERAREAERSRAALWPADPVEDQGGAIFLAEEMQTLLATARRIATTNVPVLITGETGTGKEVLARTIHAYSNRAKATFLPFNCTSTPKDMLDSQLFGHRRGSFTGATEQLPGRHPRRRRRHAVPRRDWRHQPRRPAQAAALPRVGRGPPDRRNAAGRADVRVIAATNANLDTLVREGRFREDLFYRLNIVRCTSRRCANAASRFRRWRNHYLREVRAANTARATCGWPRTRWSI